VGGFWVCVLCGFGGCLVWWFWGGVGILIIFVSIIGFSLPPFDPSILCSSTSQLTSRSAPLLLPGTFPWLILDRPLFQRSSLLVRSPVFLVSSTQIFLIFALRREASFRPNLLHPDIPFLSPVARKLRVGDPFCVFVFFFVFFCSVLLIFVCCV